MFIRYVANVKKISLSLKNERYFAFLNKYCIYSKKTNGIKFEFILSMLMGNNQVQVITLKTIILSAVRAYIYLYLNEKQLVYYKNIDRQAPMIRIWYNNECKSVTRGNGIQKMECTSNDDILRNMKEVRCFEQ